MAGVAIPSVTQPAQPASVAPAPCRRDERKLQPFPYSIFSYLKIPESGFQTKKLKIGFGPLGTTYWFKFPPDSIDISGSFSRNMTVRCDVIWCDAMRCDVMRRDVMQWQDMLCYAMLRYAMLCYSTLCYGKLTRMTSYDTMWYDMTRHDMVWYDMIWHDMVCYGMIWHDIWYDIIWYGVA